MDNKIARLQNSPMTRRSFLFRGGKLFSISIVAAFTPLKAFFDIEETLFWLKFRAMQQFDSLFFSLMGKLTRRFDNYFE